MDLEKVKKYLEESNLTKPLDKEHFLSILEKENFVVKENGKLVPTISGITLFGKHPSTEMPWTVIRADRYKGLDVAMWIDRADIKGDAFVVIDNAKKFMLKNMRTSYIPKGFQTEIKTEYPIEALKEAIINAIAHRDYHIRESILIKMFDDKIEIWSPGELLRPLTIEQLKNLTYRPKSRNDIIANVLYRRKLMDKRGTGILRINKFCEEWNLPKPEFKEECGYFGIIFKNPGYYTQFPQIDTKDLNERQKKVIEYLKTNIRIAPKEYKRLFNISDRMTRYDLKDMEKNEYITFVGSKKTGYYQLKLPNKLPNKKNGGKNF